MKKTLLEIYALLICFGAVVCFSIWIGIGTYSLVGVFSPELTVNSWVYEKHQSNDRFWKGKSDLANPFLGREKTTKVPERPIEDILTKNRLESYQQALKIEVRDNKQTLLQTVIIIVICMLLFFAHWRLAKSTKIRNEDSITS